MKDSKTQIAILNRNDKRPIAKFYRCWLEDMARGVALERCRGITCDQFRAADRLAGDYFRAFAAGGSGKGFMEISAVKNYYGNNTGLENKLQAIADHQRIFGKLSKKSQEIIEHFCLLELPLRRYELKQVPQWPKGGGSARLREALDDLVEIYRQLKPVDRIKT